MTTAFIFPLKIVEEHIQVLEDISKMVKDAFKYGLILPPLSAQRYILILKIRDFFLSGLVSNFPNFIGNKLYLILK